MSTALDVGVSRVRSLRVGPGRLINRSCRALYSYFDDGPRARTLLERAGVEFAVCDGSLVLLGDRAAEMSEMFRVACLRLFPEGRLAPNDPAARQATAAIVEALLPEPAIRNEICGVCIPGPRTVGGESRTQECEFISRLVQLRGYRPLVVRASEAVVLAELRSEAFTGIGISLGAGACDVCLAHQGTEIAGFSVPVAGDWIDFEIARRFGIYARDDEGVRTLDGLSAAAWKESCGCSLLNPSGDREEFLASLYTELVAHVIQEIIGKLSDAIAALHRTKPLPICAAGGLTAVNGFAELFEQLWSRRGSGIVLRPLRVAADPQLTTARGCLIRAELESSAVVEPVAPAA